MDFVTPIAFHICILDEYELLFSKMVPNPLIPYFLIKVYSRVKQGVMMDLQCNTQSKCLQLF